jgi:hypothetical protein
VTAIAAGTVAAGCQIPSAGSAPTAPTAWRAASTSPPARPPGTAASRLHGEIVHGPRDRMNAALTLPRPGIPDTGHKLDNHTQHHTDITRMIAVQAHRDRRWLPATRNSLR